MMAKLRRDMTQVTVATVIIAVMVIVAFGINYYLALSAIRNSDERWCGTLTLITSSGPPKPGTANYGRSLAFYNHLQDLEHHFGC